MVKFLFVSFLYSLHSFLITNRLKSLEKLHVWKVVNHSMKSMKLGTSQMHLILKNNNFLVFLPLSKNIISNVENIITIDLCHFEWIKRHKINMLKGNKCSCLSSSATGSNPPPMNGSCGPDTIVLLQYGTQRAVLALEHPWVWGLWCHCIVVQTFPLPNMLLSFPYKYWAHSQKGFPINFLHANLWVSEYFLVDSSYEVWYQK